VVVVCALLQVLVAYGLVRAGHDGPARAAAPQAAQGQPAASPAEQRANARRTAVTALLDRRAEAFRTKDRAAFLATVDPAPAATAFRLREAARFDNALQVPFSRWEYDLVGDEEFALSPERQAALGGAPHLTGKVELSYGITGHDPVPQKTQEYPTFVLRDDAWYITADDDGAGLTRPAQLWDFGKVAVLQGTASTVLGIGDPAVLRGYQQDADRAVPDVTAVWGPAWAGKALVIVPADQAQMARLLGAEAEKYARIAAVTTGERGAAPDAAAADRVIVNPEAFRALGAAERRVVMVHEISHVASRAYTRTWTPTWLSEGFADYIAYHGSGQSVRGAAPELRRDVRAGKAPTVLPDEARFETTQEDLPQAYEMGWLACRLIADKWGTGKLVEFYRAIGAAAAPGAEAPTTQAAETKSFAEVLGVSPEKFTGLWSAYVKAELK
jgi:hypothetical protein